MTAYTAVALSLAGVAGLAFPPLFGYLSRAWWRDLFGRSLMVYTGAVAVLITHGQVQRLWPDYDGVVVVRAILSTLAAVAAWALLYSMVATYRQERVRGRDRTWKR